ncbi:hypothetical protein BCR36DRAFT_373566 [Piromyces finnis]|uniref:Uncharacterized protein n=1 Tax=Piromyces finnis TaxID=1754191 RepID=A0A1Y1UZ60_9FUNG|nr:hypothetical protein BCR36DRAFT_373566 [Piromyces finnis]|eukprot:ORX43913.1 hypothetical protein BCR36DRAFT_373566 [Piromyces finnis]
MAEVKTSNKGLFCLVTIFFSLILFSLCGFGGILVVIPLFIDIGINSFFIHIIKKGNNIDDFKRNKMSLTLIVVFEILSIIVLAYLFSHLMEYLHKYYLMHYNLTKLFIFNGIISFLIIIAHIIYFISTWNYINKRIRTLKGEDLV